MCFLKKIFIHTLNFDRLVPIFKSGENGTKYERLYFVQFCAMLKMLWKTFTPSTIAEYIEMPLITTDFYKSEFSFNDLSQI